MTETRTFSRSFEIAKADSARNLIFGWPIISTMKGKEYVDKQNDVIPFESALDAMIAFSKGDRDSLVQHEGQALGKVIFSMPVDKSIAKGLKISTDREGVIVGIQVEPEVMRLYEVGKLTGLSIGGSIQEAD